MAKKYPPGYIKNPAKVAAGKARAAGAIKDKSGKYVSNIFYNEVAKTVLSATRKIKTSDIAADDFKKVSQLMKDAKVTKKEIVDFYNSKPKVFQDLLEKGTLKGMQLFKDKLTDKIENYKGKIIISKGSGIQTQVTKQEALLQLAKFSQYLSENINVVAFSVMPTLKTDGTMIIQIPDAKQLIKDLKEYFGAKSIDELNEETGEEITKAMQEILEGMYNRKNKKRKDQSEEEEEEELDIVIYAS